jgi:tRNA (guanine37-N1)-methyltransferase
MSFAAHIITAYPDMFPGPLGESLHGRALADGLWHMQTHDLRGFGAGKHQNIDDTPAGGGPGMVLRADVAAAATDHVTAQADMPLILPSPRGVPFTQSLAQEWAQGAGLIFLCNRFEGVDERFIEARQPLEVSLGDYVLAGGEMAAMVMLEAVLRLVPGVMGKLESGADESFSEANHGLLEYPHYTRPQDFEGLDIPDVVTGGDHEKLAAWRRAQAEAVTQSRRPDLWAAFLKGKSDAAGGFKRKKG